MPRTTTESILQWAVINMGLCCKPNRGHRTTVSFGIFTSLSTWTIVRMAVQLVTPLSKHSGKCNCVGKVSWWLAPNALGAQSKGQPSQLLGPLTVQQPSPNPPFPPPPPHLPPSKERHSLCHMVLLRRHAQPCCVLRFPHVTIYKLLLVLQFETSVLFRFEPIGNPNPGG